MSFAWWNLSGSPFRRVGTALRNDLAPEKFLFVFSPNPEMLSLHREEERRERGGLYGETSSCTCCRVVFCTNSYVRQEDFELKPFWDRQPVQWPQDRGDVIPRLCSGHNMCSGDLCVCVCVFVCAHACVCVCIRACMYTCMCVYVCVHACVCACTCACVCVCAHVCVCACVRACVCVYVCTLVCPTFFFLNLQSYLALGVPLSTRAGG